jgi:hypothetical protein
MRFSKPKQFWHWFQRNKDTYHNLPACKNAEALYLMREMSMHLQAYGRHINAELYWEKGNDQVETVMVFTTYGRARQFRKVERLVAAAPTMPGWRFLALDPPRPIDFFLEEHYEHLDFDPFNLWFEPPEFCDHKDKCRLQVYADTYTPITEEYTQAVREAVYNVLGEKVVGLKVREVEVYRLCELPPQERSSLINLQQAPQYIQVRDHSELYIDQFGEVREQK